MRYFIHIPKTAGTSLIQIMEKQIYFSRFKRINPSREEHPKAFLANYGKIIANIPEKQLLHLKMMGGHFSYGAHKILNDQPRYITVLRNPVDRIISEYYYMKQKGFYYQDLIQTQQLSIEDYLYHPETYYLNNLQTRLISCVSYEEGDEVTEKVYQLALKNLKSFEVIGLTERFLDSLALFYLKLQWSRKPVFINYNVNEEKPQQLPEGETLSKIKKREAFDIRLYEAAKHMFQDEISKQALEITSLKEAICAPSKYYQQYLKGLYLWNKTKNKIHSIIY